MSASTKIDNQKKDILILGKAPMLGLGEYSLPAKKNREKSYLFVNAIAIHKFAAKGSGIFANNCSWETC